MSAPDGYEEAQVGDATMVALREHAAAVRDALKEGTLFDYAAWHAETRPLAGRGVVYAAPLPNGQRVVVRHNRHGGLLAPVTGDRFLLPSRAPLELATSLRLKASGVPTPASVAYVVYPAGILLCRSDVATQEISESADLAAVLTSGDERERKDALAATATLIGLLSACGARHHDLNLKNVLLARGASPGAPTAYVLDVDRVEFGRVSDSQVTERNLARFTRSARKWRELHGARIEEAELVRVAASVRRFVASRIPRAPHAATRS